MKTSLVALIALSFAVLSGCSRPTSSDMPAPAPQRESLVDARARLAVQRDREVAHLTAYAQRRVFPRNENALATVHMFKDGQGRRCAVAELVHDDGRDDLVDATARNKNDLEIASVKSGEMMQWILATGLTQEELADVQLPLPPVARREPPRPNLQPVAVVRPHPVLEQAWDEVATPRVDTQRLAEEEMQARVASHIERVVARLKAQREHSLDLAAERAVAAAAKRAAPDRSGAEG